MDMSLRVICILGSLLSFVNGETVHGHRLEGHIIKSIIQVSNKDCAKECHRRSACLSTNYNRRRKLCEINSVSPQETNTLKFDKHWDFSPINSENAIDVGNCNGHTCVNGQVCIELTAGYECKNEGAVPITLDNGFVKGNMNDDGSKVAFECSQSYVLDGPKISTFSEVTGWSALPVCDKPCPFPTPIIGMRILQVTKAVILSGDDLAIYTWPDFNGLSETLNIKTSSNITFQCGSTSSESDSMNITCNVGTWNFKPDCTSDEQAACELETSCTDGVTANCINEMCHCPLGTSYSYSQQLCVSRCPGDLANTFTKFTGFGMYNGAYEMFKDTTYKQCLEKCFYSSSCLSIEYGNWGGDLSCYIREVVAVDYLDDLKQEWPGGAFYQRDCL